MPFSILPQDALNQACSDLLPSQRVALVRELQTAIPWLSEREALMLLVSDPNILHPERKAELKAAGQGSFPPLERSGMSDGGTGLNQEAAVLAAVAIVRSQVKALPQQLLNNSDVLDVGMASLMAVHRSDAAIKSLSGMADGFRLPLSATASGDPPFCITGGQSAIARLNTQKEKSNQFTSDITSTETTIVLPGGVTLKPDWFNFTMKCTPSEEMLEVERLKNVLGGEWQDLDFGMLRYRKRVQCGAVCILWDGSAEGMGVHVQASGLGVSELEARGVTDWRSWLATRLAEGARFARTDFAFDVKDGSLTVDMVEDAARAGLVSSHFDTLEPVIKFDGQGNVTDRGFNFGNRSANTSVVFYDKALEQRKKRLAEGKGSSVGGVNAPDMQSALNKQMELETSWASVTDREGSVELWTRCELRNRNDRAQKLVELIVSKGWSVVAEVLASALDVKERGDGKQRCRWNTVQWWSDFLGNAEKARLVLDPVIRTLQAGMVALERQYGALLAACGLVVPNFWDWAQGVAQRRLETLSRRHWGMVGAYVGQRDAAPPDGGTRRVVPLGGGNVAALNSV